MSVNSTCHFEETLVPLSQRFADLQKGIIRALRAPTSSQAKYKLALAQLLSREHPINPPTITFSLAARFERKSSTLIEMFNTPGREN